MIELVGGQGCKLTNKEAQALVDLLRRNFLYQKVLAMRDAQNPCLLVEIRLTDWNDMLGLLHKAGGWDLTAEQKAQTARQLAEAKRTQIEAESRKEKS